MIKFKSRPQCINDFGEKYTESKFRGGKEDAGGFVYENKIILYL